jgi:LysM repeat protein
MRGELMPVVTVNLEGASSGRFASGDAQAIREGDLLVSKMIITSESGRLRWMVPFAPRVTSHNYSPEIAAVSRPGRTPATYRTGEPLHSWSCTLILAGDPSGKRVADVEHHLHRLRELSRSLEPVRIDYGPSEGGWWLVSSISWETIDREGPRHAVTRANADVTFMRSNPITRNLSPTTGGVAPPPGAAAPNVPPAHVVVAGDTLSGIAVKYYRDANKWREIADLNRITDPNLIVVGQTLRLPRP